MRTVTVAVHPVLYPTGLHPGVEAVVQGNPAIAVLLLTMAEQGSQARSGQMRHC